MVSACALNPNVPPADLDIPAAFKATPASAASAWPDAEWWRGFGSGELDGLIARGRASNQDIAAAVARVRQADAQIRVATQALLPSLDASGTATRTHQETRGTSSKLTSVDGTSLGSSSGGSNDSKSYEAVLDASYEIDFWGKNRAQRQSAEASAVATRFDQANVAIGIDASIANTYFAILVGQERLRIAHDNLQAAEDILKALQARREAGLATALDETQQESAVADLRVAIPPLEQAIEQNTNALAILVGEPPERLKVAGSDPASLQLPQILPGLPSELLARRPDVAYAEASLDAARFDVQALKAQMFPSIQLTGSAGYTSSALHELFDPVGRFWQLATGVTQPLFDLYGLEGQVAGERAVYEELLANYRAAVLASFQDVDDALIAVQKSKEQEILQQRSVEAAQRAYDISLARLGEGIVDLQTTLSTEQTLFSARDSLAQVRLDRLQAIVTLYQALGGGWSRPGDPIQTPAQAQLVSVSRAGGRP
ncbi:efflux transporter outer membrane subunit [Arboricoccus pini]|nr:efflux transporter outer membrane subunit [Arboricoccus pini]